MRQVKRTIWLLAAYYALLLLQACYPDDEPEFPYFDYFSFQVENDTFIERDEFLYLTIKPDSSAFVVDAAPSPSFNSPAYADYNADGYKGQKYFVTSIHVYADSVFDADLPADSSLNHLFELRVSSYNTYRYVSLDTVNQNIHQYRWLGFSHAGAERYLRTRARPTPFDRPYVFRVELRKEDGSVLEAFSEPVVWE